jgi:colicin import membrane protein
MGLSCTIFVSQIPGGEVVGMRFGPCNGNAAVRQSIENAVRNASPLPAPPEPRLFEREVKLVFTPKESRR